MGMHMAIVRRWYLLGCASLLSAAVSAGVFAQADLPLERIKLPHGFRIEQDARVPNARAMAWGATSERGGTLFVGSMQEGKVYALSLPAAGSPD